MMKLKMNLLMMCGLSCLLFTAACAERQAVAGNGMPSPTQSETAESNTKDYVHGWTFPTSESSGKPANPAESEVDRERMLPSETDSFKRAWTFPTDEEVVAKKSSVSSESRSDSPKVQPPDEAEEYLNGWTFE